MGFLLLFLCGILGGVLGGMGMGGGTALIPLLTILCGVEQSAAQGINLLSFLPMAALALSIHAKNGLLEKQGILPMILPALLFSVLGSLLAAYLPQEALRKGFGVFLVILSLFQFQKAFSAKKTNKTANLQ
ncbi:MAG: sulfite exporter TauE/SafE family protein [Clostridia bacterium]|nr:sulfite exporter TauE/SafE family protein [Clostridia bacterium]MDE6676296.1 sulfite exporter TauE/SafE family protein [Clostridia bacterium]